MNFIKCKHELVISHGGANKGKLGGTTREKQRERQMGKE